MDLPSMKEYKDNIVNNFNYPSKYSEPKFKCPKCNIGGMCERLDIELLSNPPRKQFECNECGNVEFI